ncbi:hypothetical protein DMY87_19680 [Rhizobium wuzhouense]|uniref:Uncharacterized protein n=1 Tax=Rhizobium wuzhouense TaxID=1986026 RepID=A0ABX5NLP2_9HYPH|nr:hypothetical protein DMY87_19680 [Rhizobium wuzhouense]
MPRGRAESAIEDGYQDAFIAGWTPEENPQAGDSPIAHRQAACAPSTTRKHSADWQFMTEMRQICTPKIFPFTVTILQDLGVTTSIVWARFSPQKRQGVQIFAILAVKSWEDQILGALCRSPLIGEGSRDTWNKVF